MSHRDIKEVGYVATIFITCVLGNCINNFSSVLFQSVLLIQSKQLIFVFKFLLRVFLKGSTYGYDLVLSSR